MKEKTKKFFKFLNLCMYPFLLGFAFYSAFTENYVEASLYIGMLAAFIVSERLSEIRTSLDRIFYQIYLLKEKKDD